MSLTETTYGSNPTLRLPSSQDVNLHHVPLRGKENALAHREASFSNECMLVNTVDLSIRVLQQTFRHSTFLLHMPTKQTSADCALWTVSYQITHCNTLDMPDNIRSILRLEHDVTAPTTCRRTSCTVTTAHGCLSSLKADSGSLRLSQLLFRAPVRQYALQVFHHLAEHDPQVDNISYRIFNTMQGPIRIQQPLHQPAGAASPAYSTTHFTHHALVEITFQPFTARALMTTCHDMRIKTFSFLHNRQLMHAISARFQRLTQDLAFPVH